MRAWQKDTGVRLKELLQPNVKQFEKKYIITIIDYNILSKLEIYKWENA